MEREPAVAGKFYTRNAKKLSEQVDGFMERAAVGKVDSAVSYVAPHAGYEYSGWVEGFAYKALSMKKGLDSIETFVLVGPNHTGLGFPISVSEADWRTPLGLVRNDAELSRRMASQSGDVTLDDEAHRLEHSIEVQLPFLQRVVKEPRCCFVCMGDQSIDCCRTLASVIMGSADALGRSIAVIASSDFNHYESAKVAEGKDMQAIRLLERLRPDEFHAKISEVDDSACGYGPTTVAGMFAKELGATSGALLKYANSGDVTGDYGSVVAYSSIAFVRHGA